MFTTIWYQTQVRARAGVCAPQGQSRRRPICPVEGERDAHRVWPDRPEGAGQTL